MLVERFCLTGSASGRLLGKNGEFLAECRRVLVQLGVRRSSAAEVWMNNGDSSAAVKVPMGVKGGATFSWRLGPRWWRLKHDGLSERLRATMAFIELKRRSKDERGKAKARNGDRA